MSLESQPRGAKGDRTVKCHVGPGGPPGTEDVRETQRKWELRENNRGEPLLCPQYRP